MKCLAVDDGSRCKIDALEDSMLCTEHQTLDLTKRCVFKRENYSCENFANKGQLVCKKHVAIKIKFLIIGDLITHDEKEQYETTEQMLWSVCGKEAYNFKELHLYAEVKRVLLEQEWFLLSKWKNGNIPRTLCKQIFANDIKNLFESKSLEANYRDLDVFNFSVEIMTE